jgi:hypothetical protein
MQGFHAKFHQQLMDQLEREHLCHYTEDGWKLETLYDAALYILAKGTGTAGLSPPGFPDFLGNARSNEIVPGIKIEYYDRANLSKLIESDIFVNAMANVVSKINIGQGNPQNHQSGNQNQG